MFNPHHILEQLTLEEKASLCSGLDFWHLRGISRFNIPSIMVSDGPHGVRKQTAAPDHVGLSSSHPATCFPPAVTLASTWNPSLAYEMGVALGSECRDQGVSVLLGPGANIKRHPYCGRNFEYFSEDPLISGMFASQWIQGVQSKGVGTSLKHYALNNQESHRMVVDVIVDERTMHELYLKGFKHAITEAQPWTIMSAYNKVNTHYMSQHPTLLNPLLREQWGFEGAVITDWGANDDRVAGLKAGQDVEMPGGLNHQITGIVKAVQNNELPLEILNQRVLSILQLIHKAVKGQQSHHVNSDIEHHHALARRIAAEGIVLLKNDKQCLPLSKNIKIAVIGELAVKPRYQGSGSSLINPHKVISFHNALTQAQINFQYEPGYALHGDEVDPHLIHQAILATQDKDAVICMVGLPDRYESEGFDRQHLNLPNAHIQLIEALCVHHANVIVCLSNGAPIVMPWNTQPKAIVEAYLGGQASGEALMDVVFGDVNPSGKLAETFACDVNHHCSSQHFPGDAKQVQYREGLYVGYRWFTSANIKPLYPFGHGLSYSSFMVFDHSITLHHKHIEVQGIIHNTSQVDGAETLQVYAHYPQSILIRPRLSLIGFKKVFVKAHQSEIFKIMIPLSECAVFQEGQHKRESTTLEVHVGVSSEHMMFTQTLHIESTDSIQSEPQSSYYSIDESFNPSQQDFETLLKHPVFEKRPLKPYTLNSTLLDCAHHPLGKGLYKLVHMLSKKMKQGVADEFNQAMIDHMIREMPLRSLINFSSGKLTHNHVSLLLSIMNHGVIKTLSRRGKNNEA